MKNLLFILFVLVGLTSCVKDEEYNTNISPYQNYDVTIDESQMNVPGFSNTTWVITQITYTNFISEERTDTLTFTVQNNYSFNSQPSTYYFYSTPSNYKLELYDTPWGNLVGTLYNYNMNYGVIEGLTFVDLMDNTKTYKVWMYKL
jgi:hypothetical protein